MTGNPQRICKPYSDGLFPRVEKRESSHIFIGTKRTNAEANGAQRTAGFTSIGKKVVTPPTRPLQAQVNDFLP
jgi:hypothetical protein